MSINNENINALNLPLINPKDISNNTKVSLVNKKPYSKNHIKAKINLDINPINKGLNILDQNINCIKTKNQIEEEKKPPQKNISKCEPFPSIKPQIKKVQKSKKHNEKEKTNEIFSQFTKIKCYKLNPSNINPFVNKRESDSLLLKYGENFYFYNKILEKGIFKIPDTLLQNHKITSNIRTKMVDWMIEVLSVFDCMDETFFLSVNIMDIFLLKTKRVFHNKDIHLIGMACMFISSKFQEIYPFSLKNLKHKVGHDIFSENQIKEMEYNILEDIGLEVLVSTSVYDFLKTYFYDFYYNNNNLIKKNCDINILNEIKLMAKYLSKLLLHYEYFYTYDNSMKAIGCIVTATKLIGLNLKEKFAQNERNIYNQWILFLLNQDNFDKQKIETLVNKMYLAFNHYQKEKSINKNLNRFMKISFLNNDK